MLETISGLVIYLAAINAATFAAYGFDKSQARNYGRRISESTLLLLGLAGGTAAAFAAQRVFHHKTHKRSFQIQFWLTIAIQAGAIVTVLVLLAHQVSPSSTS
jgi:uncharacterized membrane protein YsdA (DUF1294 family)